MIPTKPEERSEATAQRSTDGSRAEEGAELSRRQGWKDKAA